MKYAVITIAGKQFRVTEGLTLQVPFLGEEVGKTVTITDVLLIADGKTTKVGTPTVKAAKVTLEYVADSKAPKIRVATFKAKARQRNVAGHKQKLSTVKVTTITG